MPRYNVDTSGLQQEQEKLQTELSAHLKSLHDSMDNSAQVGVILQGVKKTLDKYNVSLQHKGKTLVSAEVYYPLELVDEQRRKLKAEFTRHGFVYEDIGQTLAAATNKQTNNLRSTGEIVQQGEGAYTQHPDIDARGLPLQIFYIDEDEKLNQTAATSARAAANNEYKLSLRLSPQMESPKLKERAVYKPGMKPSAPMPRIALTIRPL